MAMVAILTLLLGPVTSWAGGESVRHLSGKEKTDAINGVRQTLLQAAAGSVALAVLVFTGLTFGLNRRGQVTGRYTTTIGLLASEKLDERIGGIYALEHLMIESRRDHEAVVHVLAAFVREHANIDAEPHPVPRPHDSPREVRPAADIQAALTVLGRRPTRNENQRIDLRRSDLRGADLRGAHLKGVDLREAHLQGAYLSGAHLEEADLTWARLELARLSEAHLENAYLEEADLNNAHLCEAHLENAVLRGANLRGANLRRGHLEGADLRRAQLGFTRLGGTHLEGADLRDIETILPISDLQNLDSAEDDLPPLPPVREVPAAETPGRTYND